MTIDGKLRDPFSGYTLTVPKVTHDLSDKIIQNSRETYGMPRAEVEKMIDQMEKGYEEDDQDDSGDGGTTNSLGEEKFSAPLV